ncbi:inactive pancreatic lipase-related protein 1-like [Osmerus eperlanus]|uniref:inactive pancreatic lipase-related protein 1-like n=1 Tax=Osmerus eperlanus TaxID=29151 RepID=UPI002E0FCB9C
MSDIWVLGLLGCLLGIACGEKVCYPKLDCFEDNVPWGGTAERPIARLPWSPEKIGTRFLLYTSSNLDQFQELKPDKASLKGSNYDSDVRTHFIIHGYLTKENENWPVDMCKTIVPVESSNCIVVDWKEGSRTTYPQAANNARVVGAQVAQMIKFIKDTTRQGTDTFHIIGHSLGAHAAGEAGSRTRNLGRITGLDPTEPYFQGTVEKVRLDASDAKFVDVIHTDSLPFNPTVGLGISQAIGHVDFYPNGGEHMPGCNKNPVSQYPDIDGIWEGVRKFSVCNHLRSYEYYGESILNPSGFAGYPCSDKEAFDSGTCFSCANKVCPTMGHFADKFGISQVSKTNFYLNTGKAKPFSQYVYRAKVTIDGTRSQPGFLHVALHGDQGSTPLLQVHVGLLTPGSSYEATLTTEQNVGQLTHMTFRWNNHIYNPLLPKFGATKIELVRGSDSKTYAFCGEGPVHESFKQKVNPCQ